MSTSSSITPRMISQLLEKREYEAIDTVFEAAQHAYASGTLGAQIVEAARQICAACLTLNEVTDFYLRAADEAGHQEEDLHQLLQTLAELITQVGHERLDAFQPIIPNGKHARAEAHIPNGASDQSTGFWQRIQNILLGRELVPAISTAASAMQMGAAGAAYGPNMAYGASNRYSMGIARQVEGKKITTVSPAPEPVPAPLQAPIEVSAPHAVPQSAPHAAPHQRDEHQIVIYGLGMFQVYCHDELIRSWPNRKSKSLFKYLLWHRERPIAKETLMEIFWPDTDADAARNNLNVTIYNLRQTLREAAPSAGSEADGTTSYILFQDDRYLINPGLSLWVDFEAFEAHFQQGRHYQQHGQHADAIREFEAAEPLYQGILYEEDRYDDWVTPHREMLNSQYLEVLDVLSSHAFAEGDFISCMAYCQKQLALDNCHEEAHRCLIRCYMASEQFYLAMRQYHRCADTLKEQLDITPSAETTALYEELRGRL